MRSDDLHTRTEHAEALLTTFCEYGLFNGAALLAEGDTVIYQRGFGTANATWGIPNTPDTKFRIGSVTKQFTAALVLQLVEAGLVDLSAPITDYLPTYPAAQGRVNVHHLLSHTSGIPNYTALANFSTFERNPHTPEAFLEVFSGLALEFEPGTAVSYSNSGYFVLGVIVEQVTGQPYAVALRSRLLEPLGLHNTGYATYAEVIGATASGYTKVGTELEHAAYLDSSVPYAAGMLYSTVADLFTWTRALHRGDPFAQPETLAKMTTPHLGGYAYGLYVSGTPVGETSVRTIGHGGGINGFASSLWYYPDEARTVVVLDNTEGNVTAVADALTLLFYGQTPEKPPQPIHQVLGQVIQAEGVEAAVTRYHALKETEPDTYDFGGPQLDMLGHTYLRRGETETALRLFELNAEVHPGAWNAFNSLGEAYLAAKDKTHAITSYQQALTLYPGSADIRAALDRLGVNVADDVPSLPEALLERYVGRYELEPDFVLTVVRNAGQLSCQATGQGRLDLYPLSEVKFYVREVAAQVTFNRDDAGQALSLTWYQHGQDMTAKRLA